LRREKLKVEIDPPVSPYLELAEIHRRVIEEQGPVLISDFFDIYNNLFHMQQTYDFVG
jgi:3-polyprenyl-4-hydroxybenzoate decarboxylase